MSTRAIKLVLLLVSAIFLSAVVYISMLISTRQEALQQVSRYNTAWLASQALAEFTRLEQRVSAFGHADGDVDKDEVELRFDILMSRMKLLSDGEFQDFIAHDPERRRVHDQLASAVVLAEPLIRQIEQRGAVQRVMAILTPLERDLAALASAANTYGARRVAEDQRELMRLHVVFSTLAGCLALFGIALIAFLGLQNRTLERAREDLSQQNLRFDAAINNMPHGLAMFDTEGRLIVSNRRLPRVVGVAESALVVGTTLEDMAEAAGAAGEASAAAALRKLDLALASDEQDSAIHPLEDGRTIAVSRSVMAEGGRVCIFEDVTSRIQAESQREQLEEQLRQSQKMEAVGQLTGGIAHDFNNLLTVILGNAELLVESPNTAETTAGLSKMILEAAERGADLTQKLLAFGRRHSLKPEHLNLADTVSSVTPLLRRAIGEHIELRTEAVGSRDTCTLVDRSLLESAILNLVVNARDAMPQGGCITISTSVRPSINGEGKLPPGTEVATLTITDTGCGMPPEVQARVFEPFFTTKEVGKGTGLGLSMVYGFAQQSGGYVSIKSKEGEGTSITIALPLVHQEEGTTQDSGAAEATLMLGSEKVLVVEDNPQVLEFVAAQLLSLGYDVSTAFTGTEALVLLEQNTNYDLVLTDVVLPNGTSGVELASRISHLNPRPKVLLTSGYSEEVFQQHGRPADNIPILKKPYKRADLAQAVRYALGTH